MLRVAMLALSATLAVGAIAPQDAAAQSGRERTQGRTSSDDQRRDSRIDDRVRSDGRCYDDDRRGDRDWNDDRRDGRDRNDDKGRYGGKGKDKDWDRDKDRWKHDRRDDDGCRDSERYGRYNGPGDNDRGPKFCQNGQGHPVHGTAWCRQKGWENARLRSKGWQDVVLRRPRYDARGDLSRSTLENVLGRVILGRFDTQRSRLGVHTPLYGRWIDTSFGSQLNLYAGGIQVGQVLDRNRDGRADVVLLNYGREYSYNR